MIEHATQRERRFSAEWLEKSAQILQRYGAQLLLAVALIVVLGWPVAATVLEAREGARGTTGSGLLGPAPEGGSAVPRPLRLAATSLQLVLVTEAIALPIGIPLGLLLFRTDAWGRRVLLGLIAIAAFVPLPLHATAWLGALGNAGRVQAIGLAPILVGLPGAAFVQAMAAVPWVVFLAGIGFRTVEPELEESASLEMPAWRVFVSVTLRRSASTLACAALAVAVLTGSEMTVTDLLQVRTYAEEAYIQFQLGNGPGAAAAVALPPLFLLGGLLIVASRALLRSNPARLASAAAAGRLWTLGRWRIPVGAILVLSAGNLIALPLYSLLWRAGRVGGIAAAGIGPHWSLGGLLGTLRFAWDESTGPLLISILWSAVGATATVALAWPLAWVSRRPGPWQWVTITAQAIALAAPGPVAGMALVLAYRMIRPLYDSAAMIVLADVLRTFPYALLVLWPAITAIPRDHLDAAAVDGYSTGGQIRRVSLPLTRSALLAAWGVAFVFALGELPATNLVYPPGVEPLSCVIWEMMHRGVDSHLAGVALVMLAAIGAAALAATWAVARLARR